VLSWLRTCLNYSLTHELLLLSLQQLLVDPPKKDLYRYFQGGAVASYEHTAMIKLHYSIADALEECLAKLDAGEGNRVPQKRPKFTIPGTRLP
jgi:hypothetical protein